VQDFFHPQYHKQQNIASYMEFIKWNITNITNITSKRWTISENRCFMVFVMDSFRNQIPSQIILLADTMFPPKVLAIFLWIWVGNVINIYNFGYVHVAEYSGEAWTFGQQRHMEVFVRCSHQRGVKSFPLPGPAWDSTNIFFFFQHESLEIPLLSHYL